MFASGEVAHLIGIGLRGMTSNPTIFEKAIDGSTDYDAQLETLAESENDPQRLFEALAIDDIRSACDLSRPVFDATNRLDGYVSLEVSPTLARDTHGTTLAAARLWDAVARPNAMIKIPGTPECLPSIRATIAAGININVTLLFSAEQYADAANAYILGLEDRVRLGMPIHAIASVASVFVSRIDTKVDRMLEERNSGGELMGKAGVATLKATYSRFGELFDGERFAALADQRANLQRPLWASTSTKNPAYHDLTYVLSVVGADTVNTMPLKPSKRCSIMGAFKATRSAKMPVRAKRLSRLCLGPASISNRLARNCKPPAWSRLRAPLMRCCRGSHQNRKRSFDDANNHLGRKRICHVYQRFSRQSGASNAPHRAPRGRDGRFRV